jgi:hypothetical protein
MSDQTKVHDAIKKDVAPGAAQVLKDHEQIKNVFQGVAIKLNNAVAANDEPTIKLELKALTIQMARIADLITRAKALLDKLEELESDESFADDLDEVEKFSKALNKLKSELDGEFEAGKKLELYGKTALAKHADGESEVMEKRAVLEAWVKKQLTVGAEQLKAIQKLDEDIVKALAERDQESLDKAKKGSLEIHMWAGDVLGGQVKGKIKEFNDYISKINPLALSKELRDSFAKGDEQMSGDAFHFDLKIVEVYVRHKDSKIKTPDYKKAASLLKIPATHIAKLNKALDSKRAVMVKLLDALAKELHQQTTGKDMVATLDKGNVI